MRTRQVSLKPEHHSQCESRSNSHTCSASQRRPYWYLLAQILANMKCRQVALATNTDNGPEVLAATGGLLGIDMVRTWSELDESELFSTMLTGSGIHESFVLPHAVRAVATWTSCPTLCQNWWFVQICRKGCISMWWWGRSEPQLIDIFDRASSLSEEWCFLNLPGP